MKIGRDGHTNLRILAKFAPLLYTVIREAVLGN